MSWERGLHAVLLSIGQPSVASHSSSASLWRFRVAPERCYEVTIPRERVVDARSIRIHRSRHFDTGDMTTCEGISCTTFERTLCDCSAELTAFQLGRTFDDGMRRGIASLARLADCAERLESGPGRHMSSIRALLAERDATFEPGGSDAELRVMEPLRRARLPLPVQQFEIRVGKRVYRPDFAWPDDMVFAEYYGTAEHGSASAVVYDSERLTALVAAGWLPLIFTKASTDRDIVQQTIAALRQRRDGSLPVA